MLLAQLRAFFAQRDVLEVTAPVRRRWTVTDTSIESIPAADGWLQTSPEYFLKTLLAAGAPSLYSLGPCFRADEIGRLHNPEFTLLEWYRLGWDDSQLIEEVAELLDAVLGAQPLTVHRYADLVAGLDPDVPSSIAESVRFDSGVKRLGAGRHVIVDYPTQQAALARLRPEEPEAAARFEIVIDGVEIANGYWEATDPEQLAERFEQDRRQRRADGQPDVEVDPVFMAAMRAGLPECAGVALGVDRLLMLREGYRDLGEALPGWRDR